jgi:ribose transport system ATP-binding protein
MSAVLAASGLSKEFVGGLPVLAGVDFDLFEGEVVALMGENGAGKSTLAAILAGIHAPTLGRMTLDGREYRPRSRREAQKSGVAIVTQELNLIPTLTVAENLTLEAMPTRLGVIDRKRQKQWAKTALEPAGADDLDPAGLVARLGIAQRQLVEIAAGLSRNCRVLILDEPTASLSPTESEALFVQIDLLRKRGICVVYISHRLEEVLRLADRTIVLRDGIVAQIFPKDTLDRDSLVRAMVGRDIAERSRTSFATDRPALKLQGVRGVDLTVNKGEVVGLAGLVGSGRTELLRSIFGADAPSGEVHVNGAKLWPRTPASAVRAGLGFVTEDRKDQGLFLPLTLRENVSIAGLRDLCRLGIVRRRIEADVAGSARTKLNIRSNSIEQRVSRLSGGNQQKVVLAKWLARNSDVLLLDEPTRGIDIGARQEIYDLVEQMAREGKAVLMASSDMNELLSLCDRIVVLSGGKVSDRLTRAEFDADRIMTSALAAHGAAAR